MTGRSPVLTQTVGGGGRGVAVVRVPGGELLMGSDVHYPEERPAHAVTVAAFGIDQDPVTNDRFAAFVADTGYTTVAERPLDPDDFPGVPAENLVPGSLVFTPTPGPVDLRHLSQWWSWVPRASWARPEGPGSDLSGRGRHPVVHVAHEEAPLRSPGLHDMAGNVCEWTDDYDGGPHQVQERSCCVTAGPRGVRREQSFDPAQPQFPVPRKVIECGSHLCADSYCLRYRPAARRPQMIDSGMGHIGFRCVRAEDHATN